MNAFKFPPRKWGLRFVFALLSALLVILLDATPLGRRLEWLGESARFWVRAKLGQPEPTGRVVLLGVDELSLSSSNASDFGGFGQWPFPRSVHGALIDLMKANPDESPAVLAWDFLFVDPSYQPGMDLAMAAPIPTANFPVVFGAQLDPAARGWQDAERGTVPAVPGFDNAFRLARAEGALARLPDNKGGLLPIPALQKVAQAGILTADADSDGIVRKLPLVARVGDGVFPSLVLRTLMDYWHLAPADVHIAPGRAVTLHLPDGEKRIPIDERGYYTLNYRYELSRHIGLTDSATSASATSVSANAGGHPIQERYPQTLRVLSYGGYYQRQLRRTGFGEKLPAPDLAGKIVVVGPVAAGLGDAGPTALASDSPFVLVHLNAIENILSDDYLRQWPLWVGLAGFLLLGLCGADLLDRKGLRFYALMLGACVILLLLTAQFLLSRHNILVPVVLPLLGLMTQQAQVVAHKIREEQAQRDRIRRMFGSYVSPTLVERMIESGTEPQLGGHEKEITALFSDIQSFSTFSEVLSPSDLGELLNQYLGAMTDCLHAQGGTLDKYIGDAIVAMFGAPVDLPGHARAACEAAVRMQRCQSRLCEQWRDEAGRWPVLVHAMRTRIGLNTGRAVVGNMGSAHRFNYTMMGDAVNLAARMESGAKAFGVYTMAADETVRAARAEGAQCRFREIDRIVVKGRSQPVAIYEVLDADPDFWADAEQCLRRFAEGRRHYLNQSWEAAIAAFETSAALERFQPRRDPGIHTNPSLAMIARCRQLKESALPPDWDGVYRMSEK